MNAKRIIHAITFATVFVANASFADGSRNWEWGIDRYGSDIKTISMLNYNPGFCENECVVTDGCKAWAVNYSVGSQGICFLKNTRGDPRIDVNTVSGVVR